MFENFYVIRVNENRVNVSTNYVRLIYTHNLPPTPPFKQNTSETYTGDLIKQNFN